MFSRDNHKTASWVIDIEVIGLIQDKIFFAGPLQVCNQWRGGSEAAGEAPRIMVPPPPSHAFFLLVWDAYYVVGTTCNDHRSLRNTFGWMGRYKPPSNLWSESPKNLHLTVPKSGSNIAQQYVDGHAFFHEHCSTKSPENPKGPKFSILKFPIEKKMCMFYSSSWIIFLKFKRQAI